MHNQVQREALAAALLTPGPLPADIAEQLRAGMRAWMLAGSDLPLPVCLGVPNTPAKARLAARNHHLRGAAGHVAGTDTWQTAKALAGAVQRFNRRLWPAWCVLPDAPCYATPLERALWQARQAGDGPLPETPQALRTVLGA